MTVGTYTDNRIIKCSAICTNGELTETGSSTITLKHFQDENLPTHMHTLSHNGSWFADWKFPVSSSQTTDSISYNQSKMFFNCVLQITFSLKSSLLASHRFLFSMSPNEIQTRTSWWHGQQQKGVGKGGKHQIRAGEKEEKKPNKKLW